MNKDTWNNKIDHVLSSHSLAFIGDIEVSAFKVSPGLECTSITNNILFERQNVMKVMWRGEWLEWAERAKQKKREIEEFDRSGFKYGTTVETNDGEYLTKGIR